MKSEENSALVALAELRNLEDARKAEEDRRRSAEAQARHLAALDAERREREAALRIAHEQEQALARAQAEADARAREERARLHEAETRTRLELEERLRREQMRLAAQMRISETTAAPRWPYAVVPMLAAALAIAATLAWRGAADAEHVAELAERDRRAQDDQIATIAAKLDALEDERERLERERAALVGQLDVATSEAERGALREQQAELDAKIAANAEAQGSEKPAPKKPAVKKPVKPAKPKDEESKPSRAPIVIDDTNDPLAGLGDS